MDLIKDTLGFVTMVSNPTCHALIGGDETFSDLKNNLLKENNSGPSLLNTSA